MQPTVSVILPSYNHKEYLVERLKSILNQTFTDFELIILDDNSTDGSFEILNNYKNHPKVSHFVVNERNSGSPFRQWKKGMDLAVGEIIWIAESDDSCSFSFLEEQVKILKKTEADIAVAKTYTVDNQNNKIKEINHPIFFEDQKQILKNFDFLKIPILNVSSICFKANNIKGKSNFYTQFNIIGDRVFYFEHFNDSTFIKNNQTESYFRRPPTSVSNFATKDLAYKKAYFNENLRHVNFHYERKRIDDRTYNLYSKKFFNKVRFSAKKIEKLSFVFLKIWLRYLLSLK